MTQLSFIGLGANLGDPQATLVQAIRAIKTLSATTVSAISSLYKSAPIDSCGPDYWNAVIKLQTGLTAEDLLAQLQQIEIVYGRERPYRNAPRTLDLDILAYGQQIQSERHLTLPHPRAHLRAFVLQPWLELDPKGAIVGQGSLLELVKQTQGQALACVYRGSGWSQIAIEPVHKA